MCNSGSDSLQSLLEKRVVWYIQILQYQEQICDVNVVLGPFVCDRNSELFPDQ